MPGDQYSKPFSPWRPGDAYSVENDLSDWRLLLGTVRDGEQLRSDQQGIYSCTVIPFIKFSSSQNILSRGISIGILWLVWEREILENFCFDSPSMNNKPNNRETFSLYFIENALSKCQSLALSTIPMVHIVLSHFGNILAVEKKTLLARQISSKYNIFYLYFPP